MLQAGLDEKGQSSDYPWETIEELEVEVALLLLGSECVEGYAELKSLDFIFSRFSSLAHSRSAGPLSLQGRCCFEGEEAEAEKGSVSKLAGTVKREY